MNIKTIIFVFGTRPELIKLYPVITEARKRSGFKVIACSTGQHREMLESLYDIFEFRPDVDFKLMKPNQNLTMLHAETMVQMRELILSEKPHWIVVQGDTATAHASAMTAFYERVPVVHVEAGLRTYDIYSPFPEEMNRRAIGLVAKAHFASTVDASLNLKDEGVDPTANVYVTGNTGIDTLLLMAEKIDRLPHFKEKIIGRFPFLNLNKFILATMHRRENFGKPFSQILKSFVTISKNHQVDILFPVHPNPNVRAAVEQEFQNEMGKSVFWINEKTVSQHDNKKDGRIFLIEPLNYLEMVYLLKSCLFVMTDSGGLQEEAPTFAKKLLVLRSSTERPEGIEAGFSELVGSNLEAITTAAEKLLSVDNYWNTPVPVNPFGDGQASVKILDILEND